MDVMQARELITYDAAMKLTNLPQRTFYRRLKQNLVPIYFDGTDRRKRWINRADLPRLTQRTERGEPNAA